MRPQTERDVSLPRDERGGQTTTHPRLILPAVHNPGAFFGRAIELQLLTERLDGARAGRGSALIVRGEAGVGKTSLLRHISADATDMHVITVSAAEAEVDMPFAGLQQLCASQAERIQRLPRPQRDVLEASLGIAEGDTAVPFLIGVAVLSLLSDIAEEKPILCVIDDAHWLDGVSAMVIAFVARRLDAARIAIVLSALQPADRSPPFDRISELELDGLTLQDAREMLSSVVSGTLNAGVGDHLIAETRGNPMALLEMSAELTTAQLSGRDRLPERLPITERVQNGFSGGIRHLPEPTQTFLLLAAADPSGDPHLVWRAAAGLGINVDLATSTVSPDLLMFTPRFTFRHPLIRLTVYAIATDAERRRAHQALAEALDRDRHPDRWAWHRASAAIVPDEDVACELERSADRARDREGYAAAARLLARAAELSPDDRSRAERTVLTAQAELEAGSVQIASSMLSRVDSKLLRGSYRALSQALGGVLGLASGNPGAAPLDLLTAARELEALDVRSARDTYLEALEAAIYMGRLEGTAGVMQIARAAQQVPHVAKDETSAADVLLDGYAAFMTQDYAAAAPLLREGIARLTDEVDLRWLRLGGLAATDIWEEEAIHDLAARRVRLARTAGAKRLEASVDP
jgi:hypothetical protein